MNFHSKSFFPLRVFRNILQNFFEEKFSILLIVHKHWINALSQKNILANELLGLAPFAFFQSFQEMICFIGWEPSFERKKL